MPEFNVGDRVVCTNGRVSWQTGMEGVVTDTYLSANGQDMIGILFENGRDNDLLASRFAFVDPYIISLSPVCRKIRQMEKRFQAWQEKKKDPVTLTKARTDTSFVYYYDTTATAISDSW